MVFKWLFSSKKRGNSPQTTASSTQIKPNAGIEVAISTPYVDDHEKYHRQCTRQRRDQAALAWRSDKQAYKSSYRTSTRPICPYCNEFLGERNKSSRRSKFHCKKCRMQVWADPWQRIFPSVYLTAKAGLIAKYLGLLDKGEMMYGNAGTAGTTEDFWWAAQQVEWTRGKSRLTDNEAADALWRLMNYNVGAMSDILPPEEAGSLVHYAQKLQEWMQNYKEQEKALKDLKPKPAPSKKTNRSEPAERFQGTCPYCGEGLGQIKKPSRRSKRKCKSCDNQIWVEPKHSLFSSPLLTEQQAYLQECYAFLRGAEFLGTSKLKISRADDATLVRHICDALVNGIETAKKYKRPPRQKADWELQIDAELKAAGINWKSLEDSKGADDYRKDMEIEAAEGRLRNLRETNRQS